MNDNDDDAGSRKFSNEHDRRTSAPGVHLPADAIRGEAVSPRAHFGSMLTPSAPTQLRSDVDRRRLWSAIPDLKEFTRKAAPRTGRLPVEPPRAFSSAQGLDEAGADASAVRLGLGDLLDTHPLHSGESYSDEISMSRVERDSVDREESFSGEREGVSDERIQPTAADGMTAPSRQAENRTKGIGLALNVGAHFDVSRESPDSLSRAVINASSVASLGDDRVSMAVSRGPPGDAVHSTGSRGSGDIIDLPNRNMLVEQVGSSHDWPVSESRSSSESPFAVSLDGPNRATSAFGELLSGAIVPAYRDTSATIAVGNDQRDSQISSAADSWSNSVPWSTDQANGSLIDLSKTNELLQQLIDEVRRGGQSFLPLNDRNSVSR